MSTCLERGKTMQQNVIGMCNLCGGIVCFVGANRDYYTSISDRQTDRKVEMQDGDFGWSACLLHFIFIFFFFFRLSAVHGLKGFVFGVRFFPAAPTPFAE